MAFIQRTTPTTQKDFSANTFIKRSLSQRKTHIIPAEKYVGTCFYREENKYIYQVILEIKTLFEKWEQIPGKTKLQQDTFIINALEKSKLPPQEVLKFIQISSRQNGFVEAVAREIDLTKEKVRFVQTYVQKRKDIVMSSDFHTQSQMSVSMERKKTIQAGLESQVIWVKGIRYDQRDILLLNLEFSKVKGRNPRNIQELKEYLEFDSYPLNLLEYIRIEGHPPLNREILNKFIEQRKK